MSARAPFRYAPVAGAVLKAYKATLSPAFQACGIHCRHQPTCSEYSAEAVSRHGLWAGGWMTLARFCRCRPGGTMGYDPTPTRTNEGARPWTPWRYGDWKTGERPTQSQT